jgi:signal transduction histidine kinase
VIVASVTVLALAGAMVLDRIAAADHVANTGPLWLYPFLVSAVLAPVSIGLLLEWRLPRHRMAWILLLGALSVAVALMLQPYAEVALRTGHDVLPGGRFAALVSDTTWPLLFAWPLAVAFVFPDGHLLSRRWRAFARLGALAFVLSMLGTSLTEPRLNAPFRDLTNPVRTPLLGLDYLPVPFGLVMFASVFAGAWAVRVRYRRAGGIQRLQLRWLAFATIALPFGLVLCVLAGPRNPLLVELLLMQTAVALAVGIAVTRHRLYAIDRLINRSLVYALLSVLLAVGYVSITLAMGVVIGRGSAWTVATATLVVALAFRPLRARVQRAVDWRFDRAKFDGLSQVRAFEELVRAGHAAPESVGAVLASALGDPTATLSFWLADHEVYVDGSGSSASGSSGANRARTEASWRGVRLGMLEHDARLLDHRDLLDEVLRAASLTIEIAHLRVEVKTQLAEVAASRARIVEAGYEERRRLERDLHDGAQQRLVSLGLKLRRAQRSLPREARILEAPLDEAVNEIGRAIADLRKIAAGVRPARLDEGLAAALRDLARGTPVDVDVDASVERMPAPVEAAAYFVACEALTNAVRHSSASHVAIIARQHNGSLLLSVRDNGVGGAEPRRGSGLAGLADRVDAHGGRLSVASPAGAGTFIEVNLPCAS